MKKNIGADNKLIEANRKILNNYLESWGQNKIKENSSNRITIFNYVYGNLMKL